MVTLHDAVNSVYFILHSSFDTNLLHFFLPVHSLFLLYTWETDHTNGHEIINFTGQYWLCRKVCVTLCIMVANVIHYNCVYCFNTCTKLVTRSWRKSFVYLMSTSTFQSKIWKLIFLTGDLKNLGCLFLRVKCPIKTLTPGWWFSWFSVII